jgi:hypothetical protein
MRNTNVLKTSYTLLRVKIILGQAEFARLVTRTLAISFLFFSTWLNFHSCISVCIFTTKLQTKYTTRTRIYKSQIILSKSRLQPAIIDSTGHVIIWRCPVGTESYEERLFTGNKTTNEIC